MFDDLALNQPQAHPKRGGEFVKAGLGLLCLFFGLFDHADGKVDLTRDGLGHLAGDALIVAFDVDIGHHRLKQQHRR